MKEQEVETDEKPVVEQPVQPMHRKRRLVVTPAIWFAAGGIALFIGVIGFIGGMQMGRLGNLVARTNGTRTMMGVGGRYNTDDTFGNAPTATSTGLSASGAITAVSATSITVKDTRTGQGVTFGITSSTTVTNANATASISDLKVGDTVRIRSASSTSTDATLIELNPVTRGRGMMNAY